MAPDAHRLVSLDHFLHIHIGHNLWQLSLAQHRPRQRLVLEAAGLDQQQEGKEPRAQVNEEDEYQKESQSQNRNF